MGQENKKMTVKVSISYPKLLICFGAQKNHLIDKVLVSAHKLFRLSNRKYYLKLFTFNQKIVLYIFAMQDIFSCFTFDVVQLDNMQYNMWSWYTVRNQGMRISHLSSTWTKQFL